VLHFLNDNSGAITGLTAILLMFITGYYTWTTHLLFAEARITRLSAGEPRVVAYLRIHEVQSNIVQLCVANLSGAAAKDVSARIEKITEWPDRFDLQDSKILRDLSYLRPNEVIKLDLAVGPDLFRGDDVAVFAIQISYAALDGRKFNFAESLKGESVTGFGTWRVYTVDDIARRMDEISKTLASFSRNTRLKVDTFTSEDRQKETVKFERAREKNMQGDGHGN
jgi:hypothetical protein